MNEKNIFFTSDWHVGHENSIKFDKRPFRDLNHMHESLITRYNATVKENGVCYFLGDMGSKTEELHKVLKRLNGTKILILGNHDKGMFTMYNAGFDVVLNSAALYVGDQKMTMSHCPLMGVFREDVSKMERHGLPPTNPLENWHGESRQKHQTCSVKDEGQFHLHGHIHSRKDKPVSTQILGRQFDVGVTANNYTPVSFNSIVSWVSKTIKEKG